MVRAEGNQRAVRSADWNERACEQEAYGEQRYSNKRHFQNVHGGELPSVVRKWIDHTTQEGRSGPNGRRSIVALKRGKLPSFIAP
eukprot:1884502-Pleurochrysis_carterae.AAC.1